FHAQMRHYLQQYASDIKGVPNWNYRDCYWPHSGIVVDVEGNVRQCVINTSQEPLGNVLSGDIREIYNQSEHYLKLREALANDTAISSCKNCDYNSFGKILEEVLEEQPNKQKPRTFIRV